MSHTSFNERIFLSHKCTRCLVCFYTVADLITLTISGFEDMSLCGNQSNCFHDYAAFLVRFPKCIILCSIFQYSLGQFGTHSLQTVCLCPGISISRLDLDSVIQYRCEYSRTQSFQFKIPQD